MTRAPKFAPWILDALDETGGDWRADAAALRTGKITSAALLDYCQDGVETSDDLALWQQYVNTLVNYVEENP